jgi:hypothetical protein
MLVKWENFVAFFMLSQAGRLLNRGWLKRISLYVKCKTVRFFLFDSY